MGYFTGNFGTCTRMCSRIRLSTECDMHTTKVCLLVFCKLTWCMHARITCLPQLDLQKQAPISPCTSPVSFHLFWHSRRLANLAMALSIFGLLTLFSLEKVLCDWKQGMEQLSVQWSTGVQRPRSIIRESRIEICPDQ